MRHSIHHPLLLFFNPRSIKSFSIVLCLKPLDWDKRHDVTKTILLIFCYFFDFQLRYKKPCIFKKFELLHLKKSIGNCKILTSDLCNSYWLKQKNPLIFRYSFPQRHHLMVYKFHLLTWNVYIN